MLLLFDPKPKVSSLLFDQMKKRSKFSHRKICFFIQKDWWQLKFHLTNRHNCVSLSCISVIIQPEDTCSLYVVNIKRCSLLWLLTNLLNCIFSFRSSSSSGSAPSSSPWTPSCSAAPSPSSRACACWDTASCLWPWPWPCAGSSWLAARARSASACGWWWWRRRSAGPPSPPRPSSPTVSQPTGRRWWSTRCSSSTSWSGGWSWRSRQHSRRESEGF